MSVTISLFTILILNLQRAGPGQGKYLYLMKLFAISLKTNDRLAASLYYSKTKDHIDLRAKGSYEISFFTRTKKWNFLCRLRTYSCTHYVMMRI